VWIDLVQGGVQSGCSGHGNKYTGHINAVILLALHSLLAVKKIHYLQAEFAFTRMYDVLLSLQERSLTLAVVAQGGGKTMRCL